jgi:hypothetical protein
MKKAFKLIGLIALVAIIGLSMVACDDGNGAGGTGGGGQNPGGGGGGQTPGGGNPTTYSINGTWAEYTANYNVGIVIKIDGSTGVYTQLENLTELFQSAKTKGYIKIGDQVLRNLIKTGDSTWSGQQLGVQFYNTAPNVAIGTAWNDTTFSISADGKKLTSGGGTTWSRLQ